MSFTKDRSIQFLVGYQGTDRFGNPYESSIVRTASRTRTGESNPNWKTQVKNQQNATTDMSGTFDTFKSNRVRASVTFRNYGISGTDPVRLTANGDIGQYGNIIDWLPTISTSTADNRALIAYLKHVRSTVSSFGGPVFMGELREAFRMIRQPVLGLRNLADSWIRKAARSKRPRGPKGPVNHEWKKNLSSLWLEQAFGWQPLISDINSAFKTFRGLRDSKPQRPVSGFGIQEIDVPHRTYVDSVQSVHNFGNWMYYLVNRTSRERAFVKYSGMVNCQTYGSPVDALEPFGFTIDSWAPTAWELLPWSFLIDYFTNIGDVISAGTVSRSSIAWTRKTVVTYQISDMVAKGQEAAVTSWFNDNVGPGYLTTCEMPDTHGNYVRRAVQRQAITSLGIPTLSFEIPGLPTQWANMTALFASANAIHPQRRR